MLKLRPYIDDALPHLQAALAQWIKTSGGCGYYRIGNLTYWVEFDSPNAQK